MKLTHSSLTSFQISKLSQSELQQKLLPQQGKKYNQEHKTKMDTLGSNSGTRPTFALPSEIRLMILRNMFSVPSLRHPKRKDRKQGTALGDFRSLCLVSRTTCTEAREEFYKHCPIYIHFATYGNILNDGCFSGLPSFLGSYISKPKDLDKVLQFRRICVLFHDPGSLPGRVHEWNVADAMEFSCFLEAYLKERDQHDLAIFQRWGAGSWWEWKGEPTDQYPANSAVPYNSFYVWPRSGFGCQREDSLWLVQNTGRACVGGKSCGADALCKWCDESRAVGRGGATRVSVSEYHGKEVLPSPSAGWVFWKMRLEDVMKTSEM